MRVGNVPIGIIVGLALTLGLNACTGMDEGGSEPIGEEEFGGDNRDMDPVHQEKMREGEG
jgi:hypothetical protein